MTNFCPVQWKEDPTPVNQRNCRKCGLFEHGSPMIWGEGNPDASILIILDNPGAREDKAGNQYVCGTRKTLQQGAHHVGLNEHDLYVTYILKRRPKRKYNKEKTREICINHLKRQLHEKQPSIIFCLGNIAVQSFFQKPDVDVKSLRGNIHQTNGFQTIVAYHPLAIRRRPNLWPVFKEDWKLVAELYNEIKLT